MAEIDVAVFDDDTLRTALRGIEGQCFRPKADDRLDFLEDVKQGRLRSSGQAIVAELWSRGLISVETPTDGE